MMKLTSRENAYNIDIVSQFHLFFHKDEFDFFTAKLLDYILIDTIHDYILYFFTICLVTR